MAKRLSTYGTESVSEYTRKKKKDDLGIVQTKSSLDVMDENNIQNNLNRINQQNETLLKQLQDAGISEKQIEKVDDNRNFIQKFLNLKENQGLITGTLELLNRPAEALQGALASSRTGENVLEAMWNGLYGVKEYTLDDALGVKFDDPFINGLANLAFEVAVDPFNYMNQPFKFAKTKALDIAKQAWGKLEVVATRSKQGKELFDAANGALTQVVDSFKKTFGTWGDKRIKEFFNSIANDKHVATNATQLMQKHLFDLNDNVVKFGGELKTQLKTMSTNEKEDIFKFLELEKDFDKKLFNVDSSVSEEALEEMTNAIKRQLTRTIESNMKHGYSLDNIFKNIINDEQYAFMDFTGGKDIKAFKETNEAYKQLRDIVKYYGGDDVNVDDILKIDNITRGKQGVGGVLKDGMGISLMHTSDVGIGVKFNKDYYNKETLKNIRQGMKKISKARDEYILKRWSLRDKNFTQFDSIVNDLLTKGKVVVSDISSEQMDVIESFMKVYESITNNKLELMKSTTLNSRQVEYTFAPSKKIMDDYKRIENQLANNDKVLDKVNKRLAPYYDKMAKRNDLSMKMDNFREIFINDFSLHTTYYFNTLISNPKNYEAFDNLITNDVIKPYNKIIDKYNKKDFFIQPTSMVDDATYRNVDTGFRNFINLFKYNNDLSKQFSDLGIKFIIDDNTLTNGCKVAFPVEIDFDKVFDNLKINISKDEGIFNFVAYLMHKNIISHNDLVANGINSLRDLYKLDMNKLKEIIPNRLNISIANSEDLIQGDFLVINQWLNDDIIVGAGDVGNLLGDAFINIFNGNLTPLDVYENLYTQLNNETIINFFATKGKAKGAFNKNIHVRNQLKLIDEYLNLKKEVNAINREITNFTKKNNVTQLEVLRDVYTKGVYNYSLETRVGKFINDLKLKGGYDLNNLDNELVSLIDDLSLQYNKSTEIINGYWKKVYDIQQHIINKYNKQVIEIGWDIGAYKRFKGSDINLFRNTTKDIYVTPLDKLGDVAFSLNKPNNGLPYFVLKNADAKRIVEADDFIEKINDINANKADLMYQKEEATIALEFNRGEFKYNHDNLLQRKNELASLSANEMSAELIYKNFYHNKALDEVKDATTKNIDSAKKEIKSIDKEIKTKEKEIIKDQAQRQLDANNKIKEIDKEIEIKQKEIDTIKNQPTQEVVENDLDNILKENFSQFELDDIKDSYDFYKEKLNAYDKLNEDVLKTQWFDDDYISISDIVTDGETEFLDTLTKIIENENYQHLLNMDKDDTKILKRLRDKVDRRIDKYNEGFDYDYQENKFYENLEEIQDEWDEFDFKTKIEELNNAKKYDDILTNYKPTTQEVVQDTTQNIYVEKMNKVKEFIDKNTAELNKALEWKNQYDNAIKEIKEDFYKNKNKDFDNNHLNDTFNSFKDTYVLAKKDYDDIGWYIGDAIINAETAQLSLFNDLLDIIENTSIGTKKDYNALISAKNKLQDVVNKANDYFKKYGEEAEFDWDRLVLDNIKTNDAIKTIGQIVEKYANKINKNIDFITIPNRFAWDEAIKKDKNFIRLQKQYKKNDDIIKQLQDAIEKDTDIYNSLQKEIKETTQVAQDTTKIDAIQKEIDDLLKQKDELSKPIEPNEDLVYDLEELKESKKQLNNVLTKEKDKLTKLEDTNINTMPSTEVSNMTDELTINATNDAYVPTNPLVEADLYYKNTQYLQPLFDELKFVRDVLNPNILETSVSDVQTMLSRLPQMFEQNMNRLANVQMSIQGEIGRLFENIYGVSMDGWNVQGYMRHIWSPDAAVLNTIINQVEGKVSGMVGATLMGKNMKKLALHREYQGSAYDINKAFGTELFNENAIEITALALEMLPQTFSIGGAFKNMFDMGVIRKVDWLDLNTQGLSEATEWIQKNIDTILKDKKQTSFQKLELQKYQEMLNKIDEFKKLKQEQFNPELDSQNKFNDILHKDINKLEKELAQKRKQLKDAKINQPENVYKQLEEDIAKLNQIINNKKKGITIPTLSADDLKKDMTIRKRLNELSEDVNKFISETFNNDKWLNTAYEYSQDKLVKNYGKEYQWVDTKLLETIKNNFEGFQKAIGDGLPKAFSETTWVKEIDNMIKDIEYKGGKYIVHKGVMEQLRRYSFQMKSNDVGTLFRMLQKYITVPFKKLSLLSIGFHVRNWFTNISNAWLAGINVSDFHNGMTIANKELKMFEECIKEIDDALLSGNYVSAEDQIKLINKLKNEGGEKWRVFDDYLEMSSRGVIGNNQFKSDHVEMLNKIKNSALGIKGSFDFKTSKKWINTPKEGMKKLMEKSFLLSKHMDDFGKISIYRLVRDNDKYLKLGKEMGFEATAKTKKMLDDGLISMEEFLKLEREDIAEQYTKFILFDYNNLTFREETYMKALFPFYTWMRKNLEFQLKNFAHNNPRYLKMFNALQGWRNGIVGDENNEQDYHENYIPIWNENGTITYIKFNPSYDEVDRFLDGSAIVNGLTPIIKTPLEMVTGYDFFTRRQFNTNGVIPGFGLGLNNILGTFNVIQNMVFKNYTPTYEDKKLAGVIGKKLIDVVQVTKNLFSLGKDARDNSLINYVAGLFPSVFSQNDVAMSQYYNAKERQKQLKEAIKKYLG